MYNNNCEVLEPEQFFSAPVQSDVIDSLIAQYQEKLAAINFAAEIINNDYGNVLHYFSEGSRKHNGHQGFSQTAFKPEWAIPALDADYWQKAILLTDVLDYMPQKRRGEWHQSIREHTTPSFTEETVRATITQLLLSREKFFGERVDGIFRALSGDHVTNSPAGFTKIMIMNRAYDIYGSFYSVNTSTAGYINDLRSVIAKFTGRDEPNHYLTSKTLDLIPKDGKWYPLDGGTLRIRLYKKGTAHLQVHPDMAWRLNCVLASLYPQAIPAEFRTKPAKPCKEFDLMQKPLPFQVVEVLSSVTYKDSDKCYLGFDGRSDNEAKKQAAETLKAIGGVDEGRYGFVFDYDPREVISHIVLTGCIPDHKSHQYYPTQEALAKKVMDFAEIGDTDNCLEPSAGQGGLAEFMPKDRTDCVEISALHCKILEIKGYRVHQHDFLNWQGGGEMYSRVVLNPPYADARWKLHVVRAASFVADGGRLVAILPASAKGFQIPGFVCKTHGSYDNQFIGTGVHVVILVADKVSS